MSFDSGRALQVLGAPRRRGVLELLPTDELSAGEISRRFAEVSAPAVSQHLRVLRDAGLLVERVTAPGGCTEPTPGHCERSAPTSTTCEPQASAPMTSWGCETPPRSRRFGVLRGVEPVG
ncbi:metalloregulator ArsR/SmtB family transcription factor [Glycomyces sp. NPDC047010]|uniref:ArsR/SmtB family transcription factor n=1 Tax=Glycomyces sp. NPDC047010 TaxID=3155023 RepID=UPI0033E275EF